MGGFIIYRTDLEQHGTNAELADMHLMFGAAQGNGSAAERMYRERFPDRKHPERRTFERIHRELRTSGTFYASRRGTGIGRYRRTPSLEQRILNTVDNNPSTSSRAVGYVLFTDEATFTWSGMFNMHNSHLWAHVNPHGTITHAYQERFSINVWAGIVHNNLVGPYILPSRLTGRTYNIFLQEVLPELLVDVPPFVRSRMWFQHDGAPAHFSRNVRNHLDSVYGQHWIGRGHIKSLVYESPVTSAEDLVARLSVAAGHVIDMPDVFPDLSRSMRRRCECCVTVGGRTFEHLL
ncbi:uncharacterized protein TNCV_4716151 [Trichonephila clavipes]|nr:uncharacterized protein TNCV_4716151 [Trichonephila clavipes]